MGGVNSVDRDELPPEETLTVGDVHPTGVCPDNDRVHENVIQTSIAKGNYFIENLFGYD